MESTTSQPRPRRWRRWLAGVLTVGVVAIAAAALSFPWLVDQPFVKDRLARKVNEVFAPGHVSFESISVSWFGPSQLQPLELRDHAGRPVVMAKRATLDWNLFQILFSRPKLADVTLHGCRADIVREEDGTINLIEAIRPILVPRPEHTVAIWIPRGSVQFRATPDAKPFVGDDAEIRLDLAAYPEPITWDVRLAQPSPTGFPGSFAFKGRAERVAANEGGSPEVDVSLLAERWAWEAGQAGSTVKGRFNATVDARRRQGRWSSSGEAELTDLTPERGSKIDGLIKKAARESTRTEWKLAESEVGWDVERIRINSPLANLDAKGTFAMRPDSDWILAIDATLGGFDLPDPRDISKSIPQSLKSSIKLTYNPRDDRAELAGLDLALPLVRVRGGGTVIGLTKQRAVDFKGAIEPDWPALQGMLAERIEPNVRLTGRAREWWVRGTIPSLELADLSKTLEGEAGVELEQLDVFGMRLSHTALSGRFRDGSLTIDPIDSTLNGGPLHLEPSLVTDASGRRLLTLGKGSTLNDAEVNEEVSHRVLSFVAPVLDQATRVSGRVSVAIAEAVVPLDAAPDVKPKVEGEVSFDQVEFAPGPFANIILDTFAPNRQRQPLVLNEPVSMTIVDGRVYQEGLAVPLGMAAEVGIDGSVGFDRTLDLTAHLTLTPDKSGRNTPIVESIFRGTRFALPIRGSFDKPKLDTKALGENFKDLGTGLLSRTLSSVTGGAIPNVDIFKDLFGGPRSPRARSATPRPPGPMVDPDKPQPGDTGENTRGNVPPPPKPMIDEEDDSPAPSDNDEIRSLFPPVFRMTPEERRARRQERKLERMKKRGLLP